MLNPQTSDLGWQPVPIKCMHHASTPMARFLNVSKHTKEPAHPVLGLGLIKAHGAAGSYKLAGYESNP